MMKRSTRLDGESFMEWVELHERAWGTDTYPGRPRLEDILNAKCVTFWRPLDRRDKHLRYRIRLWTKQVEIEKYLLRQLMTMPLELHREKLARIFFDQQLYAIAAVRLTLQPVIDERLERLIADSA